MTSSCFIEGRYYPNELLLSSGITKSILDLHTTTTNAGVKFNFCGFISAENKIFLILPKEQKIPKTQDQLAEKARILALTFMRYARENSLEENELSLLGLTGHNENNKIATALNLLEDYNKHGLLTRTSETEKQSINGRIQWGRTVNREVPVLTQDGPVYFDIRSKKHSVNTHCLVVQLHRYAIQQSRYRYGWILTPRFESEKSVISSMPCSLPRAIHVLKCELQSCFRTRELTVLKLLLAFFNDTETSADTMQVSAYGTKKFHHIWEVVCRSLFKHNHAQMKLLPAPMWVRVTAQGTIVEKTKQLPDILYAHNNTQYVLDAKYYSPSRSLPGWGDLVKQFYYADTIHTKETSPTRNAMIFPGCHSSLFKYIGYALIDGLDEKKIHGFSLDLFSALSNYTLFSRNGYRRKLEQIWPK